MILARAQVAEYRLPLVRPLRTASVQLTERTGFVLSLGADSGDIGCGEGSPVWWGGGEGLEVVRRALQGLAARVNDGGIRAAELHQALHGKEGREVGGREQELAARVAAAGSPAALCALDTALLDLLARERGISVAALLGARQPGEIEVNALATAARAQEVRAEVTAFVQQGFRTIKLKVGAAAVEEDIERVAAARRACEGLARLRLDANRAWDFDTARSVLLAVRGDDIEYIEEPLRSAAPAELARLRGETGVAIAADESLRSAADIERFAKAGGCDVAVLKLARAGGPTKALELARIAFDTALRVVWTDSIETAIGRAATLHAAAASPGQASAVGLGGSALLARDLCGEGPPASTPFAPIIGPGLGRTPTLAAASSVADPGLQRLSRR